MIAIGRHSPRLKCCCRHVSTQSWHETSAELWRTISVLQTRSGQSYSLGKRELSQVRQFSSQLSTNHWTQAHVEEFGATLMKRDPWSYLPWSQCSCWYGSCCSSSRSLVSSMCCQAHLNFHRGCLDWIVSYPSVFAVTPSKCAISQSVCGLPWQPYGAQLSFFLF